MKKFLVVLLVLLCIAGVGGSVYFYMQYNTTVAEKEVLIQQNGELQSSIDAIGPITTGYTVLPDVAKVGDVIEEADLVEMTIPVSSVTENTVTDISTVVGQIYKISINPGTPITMDMIMPLEFADGEIIYEQDMTYSYLPLGLKIGDYVNVYVTLPYGQTFTVMKHKRVEQLVQSTNTIKLHLNPAQQALWTSAERDFFLHQQKGLSLFIAKYVEPGVQDNAIANYPVRKEMESAVTVDKNIKDKKVCINSALRDQIELMIQGVVVEDAASLASGTATAASNINNASGFYVPNSATTKPATDTETTTTTDGSKDSIDLSDVNGSMEQLEEIGDSITTPATDTTGTAPATDANGNTATVTDKEVDNAAGGTIYDGEDVIE